MSISKDSWKWNAEIDSSTLSTLPTFVGNLPGPKDEAIGVRSQLEYYFCPVKCVMNYSHRATCMQNNKELLKMITLLGVLLLRKSC